MTCGVVQFGGQESVILVSKRSKIMLTVLILFSF